MQRLPQEEARRLNSFLKRNDDMDGETARRFKQTLAIEFRKQLEQGQISLPVLLTAQQAYLQTSLARVQAQASRLANTVALYQALGGGWWNRTTEVHVSRPVDRTAQVIKTVAK